MTVDFLKKNWRSALGYIAIMSAAWNGENAILPSKTSSSWPTHCQSRLGICLLISHDRRGREVVLFYGV
jgi:hypothetical protein